MAQGKSLAPAPDHDPRPAAAAAPPSGRPRVAIGMPVYNGERHLAHAVRSILGQAFTDFRLVILDNASTDATAAIAGELARLDPRVTYRRNPQNIGAAPNYNRVLALTESEYFKWQAHDDELAPTFLERCVAALDADPTAALAYTHVEEIDDSGRVLRVYDPLWQGVDATDPLARFRARTRYRGWCTEIFGLIRSERLHGSMLMGSYPGADLSLIIELALRGRLVAVPEPLFRNRVHAGRYTAAFERESDGAGRRAVAGWHDPRAPSGRWAHLHWWTFFLALFPMIKRNVASPAARLPYYLAALRWPTRRDNLVDLAKDLAYLVSPALLAWLVRTRRTIAAPR